MTNKSSNRLNSHPGAASYPTGMVSIGDQYDTASADSFPASDAPAWTAVTGSGAPSSGDGASGDNKEPSL